MYNARAHNCPLKWVQTLDVMYQKTCWNDFTGSYAYFSDIIEHQWKPLQDKKSIINLELVSLQRMSVFRCLLLK